MAHKFSIRSRLSSFKFAFEGFKALLEDEHNSRIHLAAAISVIAAGAYFRVSSLEWIAIFISIGMVFLTEILNSSIETLCDFVSPSRNDLIKRIKDLGAAAVLFAAGTSLIVGLIIFVPKLMGLAEPLP